MTVVGQVGSLSKSQKESIPCVWIDAHDAIEFQAQQVGCQQALQPIAKALLSLQPIKEYVSSINGGRRWSPIIEPIQDAVLMIVIALQIAVRDKQEQSPQKNGKETQTHLQQASHVSLGRIFILQQTIPSSSGTRVTT